MFLQRFLFLFSGLILSFVVQAQDCDLDCVAVDCGFLNSSFSAQGGPVFCEGDVITFTNGSELGFDYFILDWSDGNVDTVYNYNPVTHVYFLPDSLLCDAPLINFDVCWVGVATCPEGTSCQSGSLSFALEVRPLADILVDDPLCEDTPFQPTDQSCNAETWFWDFGDGTTSTDPNPEHTYDDPGTYTITLEVSNGCGTDVTSETVTVLGFPEASFISDFDDPLCAPDSATFVNTSNQWGSTYWTISPDDTVGAIVNWCFSDTLMSVTSDSITIIFKEPGMYDITLTQVNPCATDDEMVSLEVLEAPTYELAPLPQTFCDEVTLTEADVDFEYGGAVDEVCWEFINGDISMLCDESFSVTFQQSGEIILTLTGPCGVITDAVEVNISQTTPISFINQPLEICQDSGFIDLTNYVNPIGGDWSGPGVIDDETLDPSILGSGSYDLNYVLSDNPDCPNEDVMSFEIIDSLTVDLGPDQIGCDSVVYTGSFTNTGEADSWFWEFLFNDGSSQTSTQENPASVTFYEDGFVVLTIDGACRPATDTLEITVQENIQLLIDPVMPQPLCSESSPIDLEANIPDGVWSGTGIIDSDEGIFDPGAVTPDNIYTITYSLSEGACDAEATIDLEVVQSTAVTLDPEIFCEDSPPTPLTVDEPGGVFQGPGITDTLMGIFDPTSVVPDQTYTIEYTFVDGSGCEVMATADVLVEAFPVQDFQDTISLCLADFTVSLPDESGYSVNPTGGTTTWSGPGVTDMDLGLFNPVSGGLGAGITEVYIQYDRNDCFIEDTLHIILTIDEELMLSAPDSIVCISDDFLQLNSNLPGGEWSGPGVDTDGLVDLNAIGGGVFSYDYLYSQGNSCEQEASIEIQVEDPGETVDAGLDIAICEGQAVSFTLPPGNPAGLGLWDGTGIVDPATGEIDLTALDVDVVYTYNYCFESTDLQGCSACDELEFIINPRPEADFEIDGSPCINQEFCLINNSTGSVTYDWDFGDGNGSTDANPCHTYTSPGTFEITLIATSVELCSDTTVQEVYVSSPPVADFVLDDDEGCAPFTVSLTNNSFGDSISQVWYIAGDTLFQEDISGYVLDSITTDSIFEIILEVRNLCDTIQLIDSILVHPYPIVDFGVEFDEGCSPLVVDFINTTLGNPDTCFWDMGNGVTLIDVDEIDPTLPPDQTYYTSDTASTTYAITLIATNFCGTDTLTKFITVDPPEVEAFIEQDTLAGCQPFDVSLESVSTPGAVTTWEIIWEGGGYVLGSNEEDPTVTLDSSGWYTVILYAANNCDEHTDTAFIQVLPAPDVSFVAPAINCDGDSVSFLNTSVNVAGSTWDFDDGTTSTETSPNHLFPGPGSYDVTLTATSLVNDCPASFSQTIVIEELPEADFTPSALSGCSPLTVDFTNASNGEQSWEWNFGDGTSGSTAENPTHTFQDPGNYTVTLVVSDEYQCSSDTSVVNIFVFDHPESAFTFTSQSYCANHDSLCLENLSQGAIIYEWEIFGQTYDNVSPCVLPTEPVSGDTIWLFATNTNGCVDTSFQLIDILESPEAGAVPDPAQGCEDLFVNFENTSTGGNLYSWNFQNGNTSTDFEPGVWYEESGVYEVALIVGNSNGCPADTTLVNVEVLEKPTAGFSFEKTSACGTPTEVIFTNTSLGNQDNDWMFGDGFMSQETNPTHEYELPGNFDVSLIIENAFGCLDTLTQTVEIYGQPEAAISIDPAEGCEDLTVVLTNQSNNFNNVSWEVETKGSFTDAGTFSLVFEDPGAYDLAFYALYNDVCIDSIMLDDAIRVYETPIADFDFVADEQENILGDVRFLNYSEKDEAWYWDLGDGTYSDLYEPVHEYDTNRFVLVTLTAFNYNNGAFTCADSVSKEITPEWITEFFAPNAMTLDYGTTAVREFRPTGIGMAEYAINVYSPYGNLLWHDEELDGDKPANAWNGEAKGKPVDPGVYTWEAFVRFVDGSVRNYSGTITVLR
ncbi:MAG: PKD domain-containing protein [Bacteroidetes bacterium]|nr:PKD domain-containing protein [Bacteroidota bacterium]